MRESNKMNAIQVNSVVAHNSEKTSASGLVGIGNRDLVGTRDLLGKWDLYYHLPQNKNWDVASYKLILGDIDTADKLVVIGGSLTQNVMKYCMLFVMRTGITPMWEDPKNRKGGCFSYKINLAD